MSTANMSTIVIDPQGDLTIKAVEKINPVWDEEGNCFIPQPDKVCYMRVKRDTFIDSSASFDGFVSRCARNVFPIVVRLFGTISGIELWMKALHKTLSPNEMLDLSVSEALDVVVFGRKFDLKIEDLQLWFSSWYDNENEATDARIEQRGNGLKKVYETEWLWSLLVLCYQFDHAQGFGFASIHLAYDNDGHLELDRQFEHLLPHRIVYQINAIRSTMSNMIDRTMFYPVCFFQHRECQCKEAATFAYIGALREARVFNGKSVFDMMDVLNFTGRSLFDNLNYRVNKGIPESRSVHSQVINLGLFNYKAPANACGDCNDVAGESDIKKLQFFIMREFKGLCLDCITDEGTLRGAHFISTGEERDKYGSDCRYKPHDRTTWFFSHTGRPDRRDPYREAYWKRTQKAGTDKTWEMDALKKEVEEAEEGGEATNASSQGDGDW